jgi:PmbA protein
MLQEYNSQGIELTLNQVRSRSLQLDYTFNRLKSVRDTESLTLAAQVISNGRLGISTTTKEGTTADLIEKAKLLSQYGSPVKYRFPEPKEHGNPVIFHQEVEALSLEEMIDLGDELAHFVASLHDDVNGEITLRRTTAKTSISNSRGLNSSWPETIFQILVGLSFVEGKNLLNVYTSHSSTRLDFQKEVLKEEIRESFTLGRKNVALTPGNYDVLFTPIGFTSLLSPIEACLDGRAVVRGISPYGGKIGEQVLSPKLTIVNDGTLNNGTGSGLYDSQGVACRRTPLIEKGILREYFLDLQTAHELGRSPIGTGGISGISPNNVVVEPGETSVQDLLSNMKKGIVIDMTMGAWAGNPYSGQVTGNIALGFLVENGKKVGRVKNCMFSLNVFQHLKDRLIALSRETKTLGNMIIPYALVENVSISAES